jgi:hypothetical protein
MIVLDSICRWWDAFNLHFYCEVSIKFLHSGQTISYELPQVYYTASMERNLL